MDLQTHLSQELPPVCRLGLASRGNTHLAASDVEFALSRGVNYLNWCGKPDGLSEAVAHLGSRRRDVVVAVQFQARTADAAEREFDRILKQLRSDSLEIATLYYVESDQEWRKIIAPGGVWDVLARFRQHGALRMIGLTSHQRKLAAAWAREAIPPGEAGNGTVAVPKYRLDTLMIRYNAAHRGAENEVFPVAAARRMPVVTFTGLRWRALLQSTPEDPEGFRPPGAAECYRFGLSNPDVSVALTAPGNREELEENLSLLDNWRPMSSSEAAAMRAHGDRVHRHATEFW